MASRAFAAVPLVPMRPRVRVLGTYAEPHTARIRVPPSLFVHWFRLPSDAPLESLTREPKQTPPDPLLDYAVGARWNSRFPGIRCAVCRAQVPTNSKRPARWLLDDGDLPVTTRDWYCIPCAREDEDPRVRELGATARDVPDGFRPLSDPWSDSAPKPLRIRYAQRACAVELAAELRRVRRGDDDAFHQVGTQSAVHLLAMVGGDRGKLCGGRPLTGRPNIGDVVALAHAGRVDDLRDVLESKFARVMDLVPRLRRHAFSLGVAEALRAEFTAEELAAAAVARRAEEARRAARRAAAAAEPSAP